MKHKEILYSQIPTFDKQHTIPFHTKDIDYSKLMEYGTLCFISINDAHLMLTKEVGIPVIPGGRSESRNDSLKKLPFAFANAGCKEDLIPEFVQMLDSHLNDQELSSTREVLEETGILTPFQRYFGHSKMKEYYDVLAFCSGQSYYFDNQGIVTPLTDLHLFVRSRIFKPIDDSLKKTNPYYVLRTQQLIDRIKNFYPNQREVVAHYLLNALSFRKEVKRYKSTIEYYAKMINEEYHPKYM